MRRFIYIIIACSIFCYAFITETAFSNNEIIQLENLDEEYTYSFYIPNNDNITNPDDLYRALLTTSANTESNIIRTLFTDGEKGYEVEKYVLLSDDSDYMSAFKINNGRILTIDDSKSKSDIYLSTKKSNSNMQIGQICSEMKDMDLTIYPLYTQFSHYKADGVYRVELGKDVSLQVFLKILSNNINKYCKTNIDDTSLFVEESNVRLPYVDISLYYFLQISLCMLLILAFLYNTFYETKKLSVIKLFGNKCTALFWNYQKNFLYTTILATLISTLYIFIKYYNFIYLIKFFCRIFIFGSIQFCIISALFLFILQRVNILKGLKGGYAGTYIYYLNILAKIICICIVIYSGQTVYDTLKNAAAMEETMRNWEIADNYSLFYPYYNGFEISESEEKEREITIAQDLYTCLNHNNALFVNATQFEQEFQKLNANNVQRWQFDVSINPNYLQIFPLYDINGSQIQISEEDNDLILLVPEKYSYCKTDIVNYYKNMQLAKIETSKNYYGIDCDSLADQEVHIIWVRDNQGIFGFSPRVLSNEEGYIIDTITRVITERNSTVLDRIGILGKGDLDPWKVFTGKYNNSLEAYHCFFPMLDKMKLADNLKNLVSINENINERILELQAKRHIAFMMMSAGGLLLAIFIIQNTILDFQRNRQRYIIQKMHGIPMLKIYGRQLLLSTAVYVITGIAFVILFHGNDSMYYLSATLILIVIQWTISTLSITRLERKHISDVLKGA